MVDLLFGLQNNPVQVYFEVWLSVLNEAHSLGSVHKIIASLSLFDILILQP